MTHAQLADIEAAIARDEKTNPNAYYEYQGTIDESHQRAKLTAPDHPATDFDHADFDTYRTAFLAPDGRWTTEHVDPAPEHCARCWANPDTDVDVDEIPVSRIPAAAHRGPRTSTTPIADADRRLRAAFERTFPDYPLTDDTLPTGGPAVNYGASGI